jgi:hypothetical protein
MCKHAAQKEMRHVHEQQTVAGETTGHGHDMCRMALHYWALAAGARQFAWTRPSKIWACEPLLQACRSHVCSHTAALDLSELHAMTKRGPGRPTTPRIVHRVAGFDGVVTVVVWQRRVLSL